MTGLRLAYGHKSGQTADSATQHKGRAHSAASQGRRASLHVRSEPQAMPNFAELRSGKDFSQLQIRSGGIIQTKLAVSQPGDMYEQEADQVADRVMRMTETDAPSGPPAVEQESAIRLSRKCSDCEEETPRAEAVADEEGVELTVDQDLPEPPGMETLEEEEVSPLSPRTESGLDSATPILPACPACQEEMPLQAKEIPGQTVTASDGLKAVPGEGQALDAATRSFFEPRFGYAFDRVRVHTGAAAAQSARAVNALAYTLGRDIVFGAGQYAPHTETGRRLLAHELTHVVQQNASSAAVSFSGRSSTRVQPQAPALGVPILQRWSVNGPADASLNTIVCDGKGGIRVQLGGTGTADQTRCLSDCMRKHEESHRADALAANAKLCDGKADGSQVNMNGTAEQKASEFKASQAEIDCLRPQLSKVGEVCKKIIEARIKQMEVYRDGFK